MAATEVTTVDGGRYRVQGTEKETEARILAAARGSILELVWFTEAATGQPLALNPEHVVALRPAAAQ